MTPNGELLKLAAARIISLRNNGMEKDAFWPTVLSAVIASLPLVLQNASFLKSNETKQQEAMDRHMNLMQTSLQFRQMEQDRINNIRRFAVPGFYNPLKQQRMKTQGLFGGLMGFGGGSRLPEIPLPPGMGGPRPSTTSSTNRSIQGPISRTLTTSRDWIKR